MVDKNLISFAGDFALILARVLPPLAVLHLGYGYALVMEAVEAGALSLRAAACTSVVMTMMSGAKIWAGYKFLKLLKTLGQ